MGLSWLQRRDSSIDWLEKKLIDGLPSMPPSRYVGPEFGTEASAEGIVSLLRVGQNFRGQAGLVRVGRIPEVVKASTQVV
jgi:hypothetical protein